MTHFPAPKHPAQKRFASKAWDRNGTLESRLNSLSDDEVIDRIRKAMDANDASGRIFRGSDMELIELSRGGGDIDQRYLKA